MPEIIDLALGKPATQSSKHPDIVLPLAQVAGEAVLPGYPDSSFHTAAEWFPWWQVDLETICRVDNIVLYNTEYWPIRSKLFSVLISVDGVRWDEVFSKTDHAVFGGSDADCYPIVFSPPVYGRFVRIRLDNWDHLHLKSVRVYGSPLSEGEICSRTDEQPDQHGDVVVFATNYNEEDRFLTVYIENFLNYTPSNCHLVVNFPTGRPIPECSFLTHPRVHVFNGSVQRKKWGGTLLLGHMESYGEAKRVVGKFDYFCTCASNGLFVRSFDFGKAIAHLNLGNDAPVGMTRHYMIDVPLENVPRGEAWVWDNLEEASPFRRYLIDEADIPLMSINQIEGLFAESSEWGTLYDRFAILERCDSYFANPTQKTLALEEFLPVTFFRRFGTGRFTNICHMLWEPIREVTFGDLTQFVQKLPAHMCQVKWFSRDPDAPPTAALSHPWSRALLATLTNDDRSPALHARFLNRALTAHFSEALHKQEIYTPLTRAWRADARWGRVQWLHSGCIEIPPLLEDHSAPLFSGLPSVTAIRPAAWFQTTMHHSRAMQIEAIIAEDNHRTSLSWRTAPHDEGTGRHEWSDVWGILFLSPLQGEKAQVFRITLTMPFEHSCEQLMHNVRRSDGRTDTAWLPILVENQGNERHFYYLRPTEHEGEIWIGIPAFFRTELEMSLSFGISAV